MAKSTTPTIALRLPYPPSVNHYWRHWRGRFVVATEGKRFRANVQGEYWTQYGMQNPMLKGRLGVSIDAVMPDRRRRDIDNLTKSVLDSLAFAGVFEDDEQIDQLIVRRLHVEPPGCVDVVIQELTAATAATEE